MLILLNSAAAIGMGPNPEVFGSNYVQRPRTSEYPGSGKGIRKQLVFFLYFKSKIFYIIANFKSCAK
jgi:hypothetical protein